MEKFYKIIMKSPNDNVIYSVRYVMYWRFFRNNEFLRIMRKNAYNASREYKITRVI